MSGGELLRQGTSFIVGIILARLLSPAEFGLVAMAMFVVGFVEVFPRCGLNEALIQREAVSDEDWSSVYWVGLGVGVVIGGAIWLSVPVAASFYRDERVIPVLRVIGWGTLLTSLGTTQQAWLTRQMQFRTIAQVEWFGVLAGGVAGLVMASTGWGVWSLVVNYLASAGVTALLFHLKCPWHPRLKVRASTLRHTLRFGLGLQGFGIVNYLNRRLDDALIGRYVGSMGLGYYSRAYQLMLYPVQNVAGVVGRVMFRALAEIGDDPPRFRAAYLKAVTAIAAVTFPTMLGLLVTAPEIIPVVYGQQWTPAVPILQVLCMVGLCQSVATTVGWIYLARARTDVMLVWGVGALVVIGSSFLVGLSWGVMGVAVAYALATGLLLVPCLLIPYRLVGLPIIDLFRSVRGVFFGALFMAVVVATVRAALLAADTRPLVVLAWSVSSGLLVYLAWLWLTDSGTVREVRLAWSHVAAPHSSGGSRG